MQSRLEAALGQWRRWSPAADTPPELMAELPGGRTNHSYLIRVGAQRVVLRLNALESEDLGIDRNREATLHRLAADAGLAPPLLYSDPVQGFSVTAYVDGRRWTAEDVDSASGRQRLRALLERIQSLPVTLPSRDYLAYVERYWTLLEQRGAITRDLALRREAVLPQITALQQEPWQPVVVHHDLNAENLIEQQGRLFLLDWEYAACGHPDIDRLRIPGESVDPRVAALVDWMNELWEHLHG